MSYRRFIMPALLAGMFVTGSAIAQEAEVASTVPPLLTLVMRWMHIISAITMVGGTTFLVAVILPVARQALAPDEAKQFRAAVAKRWKKFVPWLIIAFIVSGVYNYMLPRQVHANDSPYHLLFAFKFLLAMAVFTLAMALLSSESWSAKIREKADKWLVVLLVLATTVVLIAGYMKVMPY